MVGRPADVLIAFGSAEAHDYEITAALDMLFTGI